jgi:crotonobetainyl-CoA:carnitine CoA-transferase CaiB-like acyl-CoA transferase
VSETQLKVGIRTHDWVGSGRPLATTAGHDITYLATYLARTGALHAIGRADDPPQIPLNCSATLVVADCLANGLRLG